MTPLDWAGVAALAAIAAAFVVVREVPKYLGAAAAIVLGFAAVTLAAVPIGRAADWITFTLGLAACAFGLLIVRLMLVRSVSLRLLSRLGRQTSDPFLEDIGGRLEDMTRFRLIRTTADTVRLTPFGRAIGGFVALCYGALRIDA